MPKRTETYQFVPIGTDWYGWVPIGTDPYELAPSLRRLSLFPERAYQSDTFRGLGAELWISLARFSDWFTAIFIIFGIFFIISIFDVVRLLLFGTILGDGK